MGTGRDGVGGDPDQVLTRELAEGVLDEPVEEARALSELEHRLFGRPKESLTLARYELVERIAEGGFGSVYLGLDPELDRRVAIKLLQGRPRSGLDDTEARSRLLREAQAMASFSHPNVVAVYDVGTFDDADGPGTSPGVFIVMEYVEGPTLRQWLAERRRGWREVLAVLGAAGRGLAAAHGQGLVHRDFKPSNVVVASDGRVRVLDFGLVRAVDAPVESGRHAVSAISADRGDDSSVSSSRSARTPSLLDGTITREGTVMGTPAYMAPEQHAGLAADERSDQYAFCVALYEALYGQRPFSGKAGELAVAKQSEAIAQPPAERKVPPWIHRIVLRGLSADPARRFNDMGEVLAALANDPALRRRRIAIGLAGAAGLVAALWGGYAWLGGSGRACVGQAEDLAGVWDAETSTQVEQSFAATGAAFSEVAWARVQTTLDDYASRWTELRKEACEATLVREEQSIEVMSERMLCLDRRLQRVAGVTRLFAAADRAIVERAVETVAGLPRLEECLEVTGSEGGALEGPEREVVLAAEQAVAEGRALQQAGRSAEGIEVAEGAIAPARTLNHLPTVARLSLLLADLHATLGKLEQAERLVKEALATAERADEEAIALDAMISTVSILTELGRHDAADSAAEMATARVARVAPDSDTEARLLLKVGMLRVEQGKAPEAVEVLTRALRLSEELYGADHLKLVYCHNGIGYAYFVLGRFDETYSHLSRSLEIARAHLGNEHPMVAKDLNNLGNVLDMRGRHAEALATYREALQMAEAALAPDDPVLPVIRGNVGVGLDRFGHRKEALRHHRESAEQQEKIYGRDHMRWALPASNVALLLTKLGRYAEAIELYEQVLATMEKTTGEETPLCVRARDGFGIALAAIGRHDEALTAHERAVAAGRKISGPGHPDLCAAIEGLASTLVVVGRHEDALARLDEAHGCRVAAQGEDHIEALWTRLSRGAPLVGLGRHADAVASIDRELARVEAAAGQDNPDLVEPLLTLGRARLGLRQHAAAVEVLERAHAITSKGETAPDLAQRVEEELARARRRRR
jgi:tetratricopeptide (TPR) repeat protein